MNFTTYKNVNELKQLSSFLLGGTDDIPRLQELCIATTNGVTNNNECKLDSCRNMITIALTTQVRIVLHNTFDLDLRTTPQPLSSQRAPRIATSLR